MVTTLTNFSTKLLAPLEPVKLVNTDGMEREDWLQWRKKGLGGSDIAAILGLNAWASPLAVYEDKISEHTEDEDDDFNNCSRDVGKELESFLGRKFQKWLKAAEGIDVEIEREPHMLQHPLVPWALANLDFIFDHPELGRTGLECKTAGEFRRAEWEEDELPDAYYIQVQWYMFVAGLQNFYVAYLIGNRKFDAKLIPRNDEAIRAIFEEVSTFWHDNVLKQEPPTPIGMDCDTKILASKFAAEEGGKAVELHHLDDARTRYKELAKEIKALETEQKAIKQQFMAAMGDAELGWVGSKKVTWKTTHRNGYTVEPTSFRALRIN